MRLFKTETLPTTAELEGQVLAFASPTSALVQRAEGGFSFKM